MWFETLTGFSEESPEQVRSQLELRGNQLISKANGAVFTIGHLTLPQLEELRQLVNLSRYEARLSLSEVVGDVRALHQEPRNAGALFQVASQFNLLEMISPSISPESGVGRYEKDRTQGPACAIACGAATIYRNYLVPIGNQLGQTTDCQLDLLQDLGVALKNPEWKLWTMRNGYALVHNAECMQQITDQIQGLSEEAYEQLKGKLRIGVHWDTEVTIGENRQLVTQAFCSALPVRYSSIPSPFWKSFACLVLEAAYEATLFAGLINYEKTQNPNVYLTLLGGDAFGNEEEWIFSAIEKALNKFANTPLQVSVVSYGRSNPRLVSFLEGWRG